MSDLHSQDSLPVMELLETILRVAPEQGAQLIKPILTKIFKLVLFFLLNYYFNYQNLDNKLIIFLDLFIWVKNINS